MMQLSIGGALNKCLRIKSDEQARVAKAVARAKELTVVRIERVLATLSDNDRERVERAMEEA